MSDRSDFDYYSGRAVAERVLAESAASPAVAAVHAELAYRYELLAAGPVERRRTLHIVTPVRKTA